MRTTNRRANRNGSTSLGWEDKGWIDQELEGAYFQDVRLGKRLRTLLGLMSNGLGQTIPLACQDWANTKAAYRFFSNPRITEEEILSSPLALWASGKKTKMMRVKFKGLSDKIKRYGS